MDPNIEYWNPTLETVDPERWVPHDYVVVQVDSRGTGKSPGYLDPFSPREIQDYFDAIEWAGVQDWSNGKVGLLGVSYYAIEQWQVAALRPPHLAAICPWEGASDFYRDVARHGGICSNGFWSAKARSTPCADSPVRWASSPNRSYSPQPAWVSIKVSGVCFCCKAWTSAISRLCLTTSALLPAWKEWR